MNSKSQLPRVSPRQLPPIFVNKLLLEHSCDFHLGIFSAVWAAETWGTWFSVWLLSKHFTYESQLRYRIFETRASRQRGVCGGGGGGSWGAAPGRWPGRQGPGLTGLAKSGPLTHWNWLTASTPHFLLAQQLGDPGTSPSSSSD